MEHRRASHPPQARQAGGNSLRLRGEEYATLEGAVARITYVSEESQYVVARLDVPGKPDPVTIVGTLASLTPGETLRLHGRWSHHPKYGEQFQVERCESVVPATIAGIQKYLGSGMIKGIGPVFARRLVEAFGTETLTVIEKEPDRLKTVEGIGPKRRQRITQAWAEQREIREVMLFLQGHGVSPAYAVKIFKAYGQAAIATVRENPYRLARDIWGIGFKTADKIAREVGIPADSPLRASAGILHTLNELTDEGHVYVPEDALLRATAQGLEIPPALLPDALGALAADDAVVADPLPGGGRAVYLKALHVAEEQVARRLRDLLRAPRRDVSIDIEKALAWVEEAVRLRLAPQQREAIRMALGQKALVITGGPGTGKTTILTCIVRILEKKGVRICLASPTGRAAKRMAETTGREAMTIHRLLEWSPSQAGFQRNGQRPLESDLIIVDEASMLDIVLMHALLRAVPLMATLLLVGDADQLPSVGPGTVLRDILDSGQVPAVRLTEIFRQAEQSRIVTNAHRINRGEFPDLARSSGQESDFHFLPEDDPERLQQLIVDLAARRLPARYGFDPAEDIQVLTPMHRGVVGAAQLNAALQAALNPAGAGRREVLRGARVFREGDRVMQVRNNYDKEVYNGDIGRLGRIDLEELQVIVDVNDRRVAYDFSELDELALAYAATVHKSQGSEYPCVILPVHTTHYVMLQRNLLYTAVTRAKRLLVVAGTKKALAIAVKNDTLLRRASRLADRLVEFDRGK